MPNISIPIAIQRKDEIIQRIANGEMVKDIAADLGVHRNTINKHLGDDPDYQAAQIDYHANRLDTAEEMILNSEDAASHTRARNYWTAVSWRAEREQRRIWGNEPSIVINTGVSIDQALGSSALALLDKLRTVSTQE